MTGTPVTRPTPGPDFDWDAARAFLRVATRRYCHQTDDFLVDDLTQEALVRLHRALGRGTPDNIEAFMNTIARRTVLDHLRRRQVQEKIFTPLADEGIVSVPAQAAATVEIDPVPRIRFLVVNYFQQRNPDCARLARAYFQKLKWREIAEKLGISHASVRKRWSRCLEKLKSDAVDLPDIMKLAEFCP